MSLDLFYGEHKRDWRDRSRKQINRPWWKGVDITKNLHHHGTASRMTYQKQRDFKNIAISRYVEYMNEISRMLMV